MKRHAGLDGYPGGWVVVWLDGRERRFETIGDIGGLLRQRFDRAAIDMPIGIPDTGARGCDTAARSLLGKYRSRVFTGVRRWMLDMPLTDRADCAAINRRAWSQGETGISLQMFYILRKVAELDRAMTPALQDRMVESHPELVFQRLNSGRPLAPKKTAQGAALRIAILQRAGFAEIDAWLGARAGTGARQDDLLDACACALAARDGVDRVPPAPLRDSRGLRMEINY